MPDIQTLLTSTHTAIVHAVEAVQADPASTPALSAVVQELHRISHRALEMHGDQTAVDQLEQAGDNAKVAAQANEGIASATQQAIVEAHDEAREVKRALTGGHA